MSLLTFVVFVIWELTEAHPIVDLRLFGRRNFWTGTLAVSLGYGPSSATSVLLPLWLQQFMDYTATDAGWVLAPVGILAIVFLPLVGKLVGKVDPRGMATFAFRLRARAVDAQPLQYPGRSGDDPGPDRDPGPGDGVLLHPAGHARAVRGCRPSAFRRRRG